MANDAVLAQFDSADLPIVLLDFDIREMLSRSKYDLVGIDNFAAGYALAGKLFKTGMTKIGFLLRPGSAPAVANRMRGVCCAVIENGGSWAMADNVLQAHPDNHAAIRRFVVRTRPDVIVCGNDVTAVMLQKALVDVLPRRKVAVAGFDGTSVAREGGFLSIPQPCAKLAVIAFGTMLSRIRNPRTPPRTISVSTEPIPQ